MYSIKKKIYYLYLLFNSIKENIKEKKKEEKKEIYKYTKKHKRRNEKGIKKLPHSNPCASSNLAVCRQPPQTMKTKQLQLADNSLLTFVEWCADNGYTEDTQQSSHFYSACDKQGNVAEWREDTDGTIKSFVVTYGSTEDDVEQLVQDLEHTEHLHQELKRKDTELLRRAALLFMEQYHTNVVHFKEVEDGGDDRPVYGWSRSPVTEIEFDDNGDMCNFKFLGCNGEETWFNDVEDHALLQDELENHFDIADLIIMQLRSGEPLQ